MKKILLSSVLLAWLITVSTAWAAYSGIECSSDAVFAENSCIQCFDGWAKALWTDLGLLTDVWANGTSAPMYMLKQENELTNSVEMLPLNGAAWSYEPSQDSFWEYTTALEELTHDEGFYTLEAWKSVDWIQSKLGYSIKLNTSAPEGQNVGLLKYTLNVHIDDKGTPAEATTSHTECVLFKSAAAAVVTPVPTVTPEEPKVLPKTGPQEVLLLLLSLLLAWALFFVSRKKV